MDFFTDTPVHTPVVGEVFPSFKAEEDCYGPRILDNQFQTIPYHVLIKCLEYYPPINLSQTRAKSFDEVAKHLFGYFKHDHFRKIFLVFRNAWITDLSLVRYFAKKMTCFLLHPTKWQVLECLPPELERVIIGINTLKLMESIENSEGKSLLPLETLHTVKMNLVVTQEFHFDFNTLIDFLPRKMERFSLHYCLQSYQGPDYSKTFKFQKFKLKFKNLKHIRLNLQNAIEECEFSEICMKPEEILTLELDGNFKIKGSLSIFKNLRKLKLKGLTKEFGIEVVNPQITFDDSFSFETIKFMYFRYVVNSDYFLKDVLPRNRERAQNLERFQLVHLNNEENLIPLTINRLPSSVANLKIFGCRNQLEDQHFQVKFETNLPNISKLELGYCSGLTGSCFQNFPHHIEEYDFSNCSSLQDEWIARLPNLEVLKRVNFENTKIGWSLRVILKKATKMNTLKLMRCENLRDEYFLEENEDDSDDDETNPKLISRLEELLELRIGCQNVTNKLLEHLPKCVDRLHGTGCQFTNDGMKFLPPNLRILVLLRLDNISGEILDLVYESQPFLEQFTVGYSRCIKRAEELIFGRKKRKSLKFFTFGNKEE